MEEYRKHDPIEILRGRILSEGTVNEKDLEALEEKVRKEIQEAHDWALASPFPSQSEIYTDIYA